MVFERIETPLVTETDTLPDTERGTRGFGSTGISGSLKVKNVHVGSEDLGSEEPIVIPVNIHGLSVPSQNPVKAFAMIDCGASTQFIDRDFAQTLNLTLDLKPNLKP